MEALAVGLMSASLKVALLLALPLVIAVAVVGVLMGALQTIVQVQDQNVAFAPKLGIVALAVWVAGPAAVGVLVELLADAIASLPRLAHA